MIDRFNNPEAQPKHTWNRRYDFRQGGTFEGVRRRLGYLESLGVGALWISPVFQSPKSDWPWTYPGYGAQDFLHVEPRFGSDGTRETAERELRALVDEAHARGIYVILDIVLNHAGRVFDYVRNGQTTAAFQDEGLLHAPPLATPATVRWMSGFGTPRADWEGDIPPGTQLSDDDAIWPDDLQRKVFFRRRGEKVGDAVSAAGFVPGDFGSMRQLVVEYDAADPSQRPLREQYGKSPVLSVLIRIYQYVIAKYDFDGFRIDTVKYVAPSAVETFGNAMREFALSVGKKNFFTFGEIWDSEETIARFVGRNSPSVEGFGIDAALDFPLFYGLPGAAKGQAGVEKVRDVYARRKEVEQELLSSHGEASRFFVTFLDNHDQHARFFHPNTPRDQVTTGLALLFTLQGIPTLYYGTEQGLTGTVGEDGGPALNSFESVREALWGRGDAFDRAHPLFQTIRALSDLRLAEPALRYGRQYFREVSGDGAGFGHSFGNGVLAFSRILVDREVLVVANTNTVQPFRGAAVLDLDLTQGARRMRIAFSNQFTGAERQVRVITDARFYRDGVEVGRSETAALDISVNPGEVQIWVPA
ncbi:MAG TPA: alpha-amylase family glycosyl hydrolase [Pyrinomonadaceae bacterium]